jgi:hypothetical protein
MSELSYLRGIPIPVASDIFVHPITLAEVEEIGIQNYYSFINCLCIKKETLLKMYQLSSEEYLYYKQIDEFTILMSFAKALDDFRLMISNSLSFFLKAEVDFSFEHDLFSVFINENEVNINSSIFEKIKSTVLKLNFMNNSEDESKKFSPANEKAKQLKEKMDKLKQKIQKQNSEDGLELKDIVSIVATYSNDINILTVWDLTVYQLYESYMRILLWDEYHTTHFHLPNMDEQARKNLKHWASDINKLNK